jgi:hypothetical protein
MKSDTINEMVPLAEELHKLLSGAISYQFLQEKTC